MGKRTEKADEALRLLGRCAEGHGPPADEAYAIVEAELTRLRALVAEADEALSCASCAQDYTCSRHGDMNGKIREALDDEELRALVNKLARRAHGRERVMVVELYADPTNHCDDAHRSDIGSHLCTMTKGHGGPVHVEVDPVFGNPRWVWLADSSRERGRSK